MVRFLLCACIAVIAPVAHADPQIRVTPIAARPGDAVLVTVTGASTPPRGTADGAALHFFRARTGYQAVFAIPIDHAVAPLRIAVDGAPAPITVQLSPREFRETAVAVEDALANPPASARSRITADNAAIVRAMSGRNGAPQFTQAFRRPRGGTTSPFGVWRVFNRTTPGAELAPEAGWRTDPGAHRSQHLGQDYAAREGARVAAINAGTVTLVRDTYLAGTVVVIAHGGGIASAYFHLSATDVAEGDLVERGDVIGRAGQTGRATGPHLHLAIRAHGGLVDPASFFRLAIAPAAPATARR